jgi:hypothetical protein
MNHLKLLLLVGGLAAVVLPSCGLLLPKPDYKPHDKLAVVPQDFLFTTHAPFNTWLDTPVRMQVTEMPLIEVFDHPALRRLRIVWTRRPKENPPVTIHRIAITRRQILWSLSQDHQLTMLPVTLPDGQSYVEIIARGS